MKAIIFDFNRTLYDPEVKALSPRCLKVLQTLATKLKLVLVTTTSVNRESLLKSLAIEKFFAKIIVAEDKTERDFQDCCDFLGVKPEEVVVVGDRIGGEISVGNKMGMFTVRYKQGRLAGEVPTCEFEVPKSNITKLEDLLELMSKLK